MEFLISISLQRNGVGGYENSMLDLMSNFAGVFLAPSLLIFGRYFNRLKDPT